MPYYQERYWKEGDLPIAEDYYSVCISLPMYASLAQDEQQIAIDLILSYFE